MNSGSHPLKFTSIVHNNITGCLFVKEYISVPESSGEPVSYLLLYYKIYNNMISIADYHRK